MVPCVHTNTDDADSYGSICSNYVSRRPQFVSHLPEWFILIINGNFQLFSAREAILCLQPDVN